MRASDSTSPRVAKPSSAIAQGRANSQNFKAAAAHTVWAAGRAAAAERFAAVAVEREPILSTAGGLAAAADWHAAGRADAILRVATTSVEQNLPRLATARNLIATVAAVGRADRAAVACTNDKCVTAAAVQPMQSVSCLLRDSVRSRGGSEARVSQVSTSVGVASGQMGYPITSNFGSPSALRACPPASAWTHCTLSLSDSDPARCCDLNLTECTLCNADLVGWLQSLSAHALDARSENDAH